MRQATPRWLHLAALVPALAIGCAERESAREQGHPGGENLAGRLDAAKGIRNVTEKDEALAMLVQAAADAGNVEITDQALAEMRDVGTKDKAAYSAAIRLAKAGKTAAATATANVIRDVTTRDRTLAKIAKGDTSE